MVEVLNNPVVHHAIKVQKSKDELRFILAKRLMSTKTWDDMDKFERDVCQHVLVSESETEEELRTKLGSIGVEDYSIYWHQVDENNKTDCEGRMLVKALGGLISKSGALVMISTRIKAS